MTTFVVTDTGGWTELGSGDLPASGVTPGTYGDATHVGQVTVNAAGQVTAASDVAISASGLTVEDGSTTVAGATTLDFTSGATVTNGGGGVAQVAVTGGGGVGALLYSNVLAVDTATIDTGAGGIAGGYNILEIWVLARTDEAAVLSQLLMRLNNDSGANYDFVWQGTSNTTSIPGNNRAQTAWGVQTLGASAGANVPGNVYIQMPAYAETTFYKSANLLATRADGSAAANMSMLNFGGTYRSTAVISRFAVTPQTAGVKMKAGSAVYIYGK